MRNMRLVAGFLLGVAVALFGSTPVQAAGENCLLIICVDAPVVGPIVGGIGEGVGDLVTPQAPAPAPAVPQQPAPAPQAPVEAPAVPAPQPAAPAPAPQTPVQNAPSTGSGNTSPSWTPPSVIVDPMPTGTTSPSPEPEQTSPPTTVYDFDNDGKQDENAEELQRWSPLTPFLLGGLIVLFAAISVSAFGSYFSTRPKSRLR